MSGSTSTSRSGSRSRSRRRGVLGIPTIILVVAASASLALGAQKKGSPMSITVESHAFKSMQPIPVQYTCDGADISPPITWKGLPTGTRSVALIGDDPDAPAGVWVHWVCYDIPPSTDRLEERQPTSDTLACGGKQGITDFGRIGYGGPCPPSGTHRYFFKVYALDTIPDLPAGKSKKQVEQAMQGHILARGELVGTYSRQ